MNIHEYQAKQIFKEYGLSVPEGRLATTPEEVVAAYEELGPIAAVKAQVHTGGRGKAGGVKVVKSVAEAREAADAILGMDIKGHTVNKVYVEAGADIAQEAYLSVLIDRSAKNIGYIASAAGGMDIEQVAEETPDQIIRFGTNNYDFPEAEAQAAAVKLFGSEEAAPAVAEVMRTIFKIFLEKDAQLVEINPLVLTGAGEVVCLDGKMSFDDNALFRQESVVAMRDMQEEDENEIEAKAKGLSFIQLDGDIGCMVNGAGLAMATMDMINLYGGDPANFLDVGGSSNPEKVVNAFKLILASGRVKAVLINIFGGITRCDDIAKGILTAFEQMEINLPVVVRLAGTNAEEGKALLEGSSLIPATSLSEAVKKTIELGKGASA